MSEHKQTREACSSPPPTAALLLLTPRLPSARVSSQIHFWSRCKLFGKALSFFITRTHRVHLCLFRRKITSHPDMFIIKNQKKNFTSWPQTDVSPLSGPGAHSGTSQEEDIPSSPHVLRGGDDRWDVLLLGSQAGTQAASLSAVLGNPSMLADVLRVLQQTGRDKTCIRR